MSLNFISNSTTVYCIPPQYVLSVACNVAQSLLHVQIYSTAAHNRCHILCPTICLRHRALPKHVALHVNDFQEGVNMLLNCKQVSQQTEILELKVFGYVKITSLLPSMFMLLDRYATVVCCCFKNHSIQIPAPDYVVGQGMVRIRLNCSLPGCSMEHFKTQQGTTGHNMGISEGSQV